MPAARPHLRRAAARQGAPDRARQGSARRQEAGQGHPRAGGLPGRTAADDRERHLRRQRHRARHRLAAAPQPGRVLRSRPGQDAQLRQAAVLGARHSLPRLVARLRVRRRRTACSRASTAAASCRSRSCCARSGYSDEQMLDIFFEKNTFYLSTDRDRAGPRAAAPARRDRELRDQASAARSSSRKAAASPRATCARSKTPRSTRLPVPPEYLVGKVLAHDVVNTETGEILAKANEMLTAATDR